MFRNQGYADRLLGRNTSVSSENKLGVTVKPDKDAPRLTKLGKQLASIGFVEAPAKATVLLSRYGVAVGISDNEVVVGNLERANDWSISHASFFEASDVSGILQHISRTEAARKTKVQKAFLQAIERLQADGVLGTYDKANQIFTTQMGARITARTWFQGQFGLWARIEHKHGGVAHHSILRYVNERKDPSVTGIDEGYATLISRAVRRHELNELEFTGRLRGMQYDPCGHTDYPKIVHHNCGHTLVTSLKK